MATQQLFAALQYASLGWAVIPVFPFHNGKCDCNDPTCDAPGKHPIPKGWQNQGTKDPKVIEKWWTKWPQAGVGIVTGSLSGIIVLDVDPDKGGDESLLDLTSQQRRLPDTVQCLTGGGGKHFYFQTTQTILHNSAGKLAPGLDIRAEGGFVVAPPSLHKSGRCYEWETSSDPANVPVAPIPNWLLQLIQPSGTSPASNNNGHHPQIPAQPKKIGRGKRNQILASKAGTMRRVGFPQASIEQALLEYNKLNCNPPLTDQEVLTVARSISRYSPARVPTDDELAQEWLQQYPDTAYGLGEFHRYQNGFWPMVPLTQVKTELLSILENAKSKGINPTAWKLRSVTELAQIKSGVSDDLWDANPDVLVCANGTLEIPTRTIRGFSKTDYCTSRVNFNYDPKSAAPTWERYLNQTLPGTKDFLQEFAGYCLTTETRYEIAVWLFGPAGCGKSTFIEGLLSMLSGRAGPIGLADIERSQFGMTNISGKTLLYATEQPAMFVQVTNIINALISGETVTIHRKFRDPVDIISRAKILWAMNELPRIPEAGSGLFRRVKVVEFPPLPEKKRRPEIKEQIRSEGAGILNWALEGLDALRQDGAFTVPKEVTDATQQFQLANDVPSAFLEDRVELDPTIDTSATFLYVAYRDWCLENGHKPQSSTSLAMDWKRLGLVKSHTRTGTLYKGIKVKP